MCAMTSRQRVMNALNFKSVDRIPMDLGGMASTGISGFAYPKLVAKLGLPPRLPRIHDTHQMLALPDMDVLDKLECDVVTVFYGVTNAYPEPDKWHPYDFNGRLPAMVRDPKQFTDMPDGSVSQPEHKIIMQPTSHVFNAEHSGMPLTFSDELPLQDLKKLKADLLAAPLTDKDIKDTVEMCKRAYESTDKAVFFNGPFIPAMGISAHGGLGVFPVICLMYPDYVAELHDILSDQAVRNIRTLLPEIKQYIQVAITGGDDWGTQNALIASPDMFRSLFKPYLTKVNTQFHSIAPKTKTFIHSCGAIYELIDDIIECGFDILNPVQWPAGGKSFKQWKDKARKRISLWGGGVNAQATLPLGSVEDVENEVAEVVQCLKQDGGYVFNCIHNILAEIEPEKIIAMYKTAKINGQ